MIADRHGKLARALTTTIRRALINVPARITTSARRLLLHGDSPERGTDADTLDAVDWLAEKSAQHLTEAGTANLAGECVPGGTTSASGSELVRIAQTQLGKPCVWGAAGPSGFDCSGLVRWSLAQMGVSIVRTADEQARAGKEVWTGTCSQLPENLLAPDDLVGFAEDNSHHQHIGIWVSPGKMIHSPQPGGVAHGSVFATPFGYPGKVYDTCASCASSPMWLDVYTK